eukprot:scaffold162_cov176-Amphora_coffeaeformis.AAC.4
MDCVTRPVASSVTNFPHVCLGMLGMVSRPTACSYCIKSNQGKTLPCNMSSRGFPSNPWDCA